MTANPNEIGVDLTPDDSGIASEEDNGPSVEIPRHDAEDMPDHHCSLIENNVAQPPDFNLDDDSSVCGSTLPPPLHSTREGTASLIVPWAGKLPRDKRRRSKSDPALNSMKRIKAEDIDEPHHLFANFSFDSSKRSLGFDTEQNPSITEPPIASYSARSPPIASSADIASPTAPRSDIEGAVRTLQPGQWLSTTAVDLVLRALLPPTVRIVDGTYLRIGDGSRSSPKTPLRLRSEEAFLVVPLNHQSHWSLAVLDVQARVIDYFDSMRKNDVPVRQIMHRLTMGFPSDKPFQEWAFHPQECPLQQNTNDCGVHLLINALRRLAGSKKMASYACDVWRSVFRNLVDGKDDVTEAGKSSSELSQRFAGVLD